MQSTPLMPRRSGAKQSIHTHCAITGPPQVTMGSLQSAVLGFGLFKSLQRFGWGQDFTVAECVIVQTTAVATATMPLAAGLVGVVPALVSPEHASPLSLISHFVPCHAGRMVPS